MSIPVRVSVTENCTHKYFMIKCNVSVPELLISFRNMYVMCLFSSCGQYDRNDLLS